MLQSFLPSFYAETDDDQSTSDTSSVIELDDTTQHANNNEPLCLEGYLYCRKKHLGSFSWKRRFVVLSLENDGGSLTVFRLAPEDAAAFETTATTALRKVYSRPAKMAKSIQRKLSIMGGTTHVPGTDLLSSEERRAIDVQFPSSVGWVAKDIVHDGSTFMVEIPKDGKQSMVEAENDNGCGGDNYDGYDDDDNDGSDVSSLESNSVYDLSTIAESLPQHSSSSRNDDVCSGTPRTVLIESTQPVRIYFRCQKGKGSNEKALWLRAFDRLGRLSSDKYHSLLGTIANKLTYHKSRNRIRSKSNQLFARHVRQLELEDDDQVTHSEVGNLEQQASLEDVQFVHHDVEQMVHGSRASSSKNKEYRVHPRYAYPHRWMTRQEMMEEMSLTSEIFHDLRMPCNKQKEIGSLKVEVLQCFGLPKLDRTADTDGIVYLVCGSYAFATDVIPNNANPMWLRKSKRACNIPLFHAFARLYVGVFDDDTGRTKDEFAGRVVLDLARLRPGSTYDVTLPLRLSAHVYSRRRRGAIRLRLSLRWHAERDALMSYIPQRIHIPLPQNSRPNTDVSVLCSDPKAFRNIAITIHGAHLPGKFTFHQMRATIREINYTRKYIFTLLRLWIRETRHWHFPTFSAFVFLSWMHCVYANTFALVPAYIVSYFCLVLTKNYVKYSIDGPNNRGFIPPAWEELFMALIRGGDPNYHAIESLELGLQATSLSHCQAIEELGDGIVNASNSLRNTLLSIDYKAKTHVPQGKLLFRLLGLLQDSDDAFISAEDNHLEFPFADGDIKHYPPFTVKEALVGRNGADLEGRQESIDEGASAIGDRRVETNGKGEIRLIPRLPKRLEIEITDLMRKDSSGMNDRDEEEIKFNPRRAVLASGKHVIASVSRPTKRTVKDMTGAGFSIAKTAAKSSLQAATTVAKTAGEFGEMTGLHHVVTPVTSTIQTGYQGVNTLIGPVGRSGHKLLRSSLKWDGGDDPLRELQAKIAIEVAAAAKARSSSGSDGKYDLNGSLPQDALVGTKGYSALLLKNSHSDVAPATNGVQDLAAITSTAANQEKFDVLDQPVVGKWPEQNVDVEGPSTGRKLTDDLQEIKDRIQDLTWHLFDDKIYVIKNREALYFGEAKKPEKRRTTRRIDKDLDKLMKVGQYSHNNPFVARMGQYVEPIIGAATSFLCLFRASFNVMTWRDPLLTFWISLVSGVSAIILFVFPWRLFLFGLGMFLVGPHLWALRLLREKGYLPPAKKKKKKQEDEFETGVPSGQPVFTAKDRKSGCNMSKSVKFDPREVHRIVVPYSPLIYNRFYDWPPEPQYAQVKRDAVYDSSMRRAAVLLSRKPRNFLRARAASSDNRTRDHQWVRRRTSSYDGAPMPALPESPVVSGLGEGMGESDDNMCVEINNPRR
ncbi:hypothetical protein MPSEU_000485200 [Mayamaea pseudoterrestris]|nr:hypothetical protein MPSEU_000485200 [Mayamaea pseudoterrestris]